MILLSESNFNRLLSLSVMSHSNQQTGTVRPESFSSNQHQQQKEEEEKQESTKTKTPGPTKSTLIRYTRWLMFRESRIRVHVSGGVKKGRELERYKRQLEFDRRQQVRADIENSGWKEFETNNFLSIIAEYGAPPELGGAQKWKDEEPWCAPTKWNHKDSDSTKIRKTNTLSGDSTDLERRTIEMCTSSGIKSMSSLYSEIKRSHSRQRCKLSIELHRDLLLIRGFSQEEMSAWTREKIVKTLKSSIENELGIESGSCVLPDPITRIDAKPEEKRWAHICELAGLNRQTPSDASQYWWQKLYPHCVQIVNHCESLGLFQKDGEDQDQALIEMNQNGVLSDRIMPQYRMEDYSEKGLRFAKSLVDTTHLLHRVRCFNHMSLSTRTSVVVRTSRTPTHSQIEHRYVSGSRQHWRTRKDWVRTFARFVSLGSRLERMSRDVVRIIPKRRIESRDFQFGGHRYMT